MSIFLFQIIFFIFSLFVIGTILFKGKGESVSLRARFFWVFFWLLADVAVFLPELITKLANHFGIGRGSDFVLYLSIALMFFLLFRLHLKIESISRDVTKVVRSKALEK